MGDMDEMGDGPEMSRVEFVLMFQGGHSDGYNHSYGGPLYESSDAAEFVSRQQHGAYAIEPKPVSCVVIDGRVYIVDGPYKTYKDVEMEDKIRAAALAKLTAAEIKALGLDGKKKP